MEDKSDIVPSVCTQECSSSKELVTAGSDVESPDRGYEILIMALNSCTQEMTAYFIVLSVFLFPRVRLRSSTSILTFSFFTVFTIVLCFGGNSFGVNV